MGVKPVSRREFIVYLRSKNISITNRIVKAIAQAELTHGKHKRISGEPVLEQHIFPVALDVMKFYEKHGINCPENVIVATLLHDVLEDDYLSDDFFIDEFGKDVFAIVKPMTKVLKPPFKTDEIILDINKRLWENIKNAHYASIIIKLADKLNNLRSDIKIRDLVPLRVSLDMQIVEQEYIPYMKTHNRYYYDKYVKALNELKTDKMTVPSSES